MNDQEYERPLTGFQRFTSLESFAHVYRGQDYFESVGAKKATVTYGAKIKLHGTNAGVRVTPDGDVIAQSRTQDITPDNDNAGFANWVHKNADQWKPMACSQDVVVYGEWAGKGIQKGDAVTKLSQKYFFVFGVYFVREDMFVHSPEVIEEIVPDLDDLVVLPWDMVFTPPVDFSDAELCDTFSALLTEQSARIGERDPFIYSMFGVEGVGEGWVISPICDPTFLIPNSENTKMIPMHWYRTLAFKVKTEAHSVKKAKPAARVLEVPQGVLEFIDVFVTEARCKQGLSETGDRAVPEQTGQFLKWIGQDVKKESVQELQDMGLEWKDVTKQVMEAAKNWWMKECQKIT